MEKKQKRERPIRTSKVLNSPRFKEIMENYQLVGQHMSIRKFYLEYVSKIDPGISKRMWEHHMSRYNARVVLKSEDLMNKIAEKEATAGVMEEDSVRKILAIADLTLNQVVEHPDILLNVPIGQRMSWLFSSMKARDSRMNVVLKKKEDDRKQNMYEDILKGAQFGAINADDTQVTPSIISEPKSLPEPKNERLPNELIFPSVSEKLKTHKFSPPGEIVRITSFNPEDLNDID